MSMIRCRTIRGISTYDSVVTSPATTTRPVVTRHSTATRLFGSCRSSSSSTVSLIWSAILSGCPSVTDSDVKSLRAMGLVFRFVASVERRAQNAVRQDVFAATDRLTGTVGTEQDDLTVG